MFFCEIPLDFVSDDSHPSGTDSCPADTDSCPADTDFVRWRVIYNYRDTGWRIMYDCASMQALIYINHQPYNGYVLST